MDNNPSSSSTTSPPVSSTPAPTTSYNNYKGQRKPYINNNNMNRVNNNRSNYTGGKPNFMNKRFEAAPVYYAPPIVYNPDVAYLTNVLKQQLEYYFSVDNLVRDVFLRRYMDEAGFVPIALLANFNRIKSISTDFQIIMRALNESTLLEVDMQTLTVRLANGWEAWRVPQTNGSIGLPAWRAQIPPMASPSSDIKSSINTPSSAPPTTVE